MRIIYPRKQKKIKRPRRSRPLKRCVHVDGKEWRWETTGHWDSDAGSYGCLTDQNVKILSPDNRFFSIRAHEVMKCKPIRWECCVGEKLITVLPEKVKQYIIDNLIGSNISRQLKRRIHIDGKEWGWQFSKGNPAYQLCGVSVRSPDNRYLWIYAKELGYEIKPSVIKQHIIDNLLYRDIAQPG